MAAERQDAFPDVARNSYVPVPEEQDLDSLHENQGLPDGHRPKARDASLCRSVSFASTSCSKRDALKAGPRHPSATSEDVFSDGTRSSYVLLPEGRDLESPRDSHRLPDGDRPKARDASQCSSVSTASTPCPARGVLKPGPRHPNTPSEVAFPNVTRNSYLPVAHESAVITHDRTKEERLKDFWTDVFGPFRQLLPCMADERLFVLHCAVLVCFSAYYCWCIYMSSSKDNWLHVDEKFVDILRFGCRKSWAGIFAFTWPMLPLLLLVAEILMRKAVGCDLCLEMAEATLAAKGKEGQKEVDDLYSDIYVDPKRRPKKWKVSRTLACHLRRRLALSICAMLVPIAAKLTMDYAYSPRYAHHALAEKLLGPPLAFIVWRAMLLALIEFYFICQICFNEIERFRLKLDLPTDQIRCWRLLAGQHHYLDRSLAALWHEVAWPLFIGIAGVSLLSLGCLNGGINNFQHGDMDDAFFYFASIFSIAVLLLATLHPPVQLTELCMAQTANKTSVLLSAAKHSHNEMDQQHRLEYLSFMFYIHNTVVGVELPLVGKIDYTFLFSKAAALASIVPILLTIFVEES